MAHARGNRMRKGWLPIPAFITGPTADGMTLGSLVDFTGPGTILRMLGSYIITATASVDAADCARIAVGIGLLSSDALAAGSASVPDPGSELEFPWLYWAEHSLRFSKAQSTTISGDSTGSAVRAAFDVRSMRKFKEREGLGFIIEYLDMTGAPPLTITASSTRVLVGL